MGLPWASLLPLIIVASCGLGAKATNRAFHGLVCCLWSLWILAALEQRQQIAPSMGQFAAFDHCGLFRLWSKGNKSCLPWASLLPLIIVVSFGSGAKATNRAFHGLVCCLWSWGVSLVRWLRQQKSSSEGLLAASDKDQVRMIPRLSDSQLLRLSDSQLLRLGK